MSYIILNEENIKDEHICCAFSDKKCIESYEAKKEWINTQLKKDFIFERLDERAKVFIETVPCEEAWVPVQADNFIFIGCFWVSGKYKNNGHGKKLLEKAIVRCKEKRKDGLVTVVGKKKFHFMSDTKWFLNQGFEIMETTDDNFILLALKINKNANNPSFRESVYKSTIPNKGCAVYYSNRCPYSEYHVKNSLVESCKQRKIPLDVIKIKTLEEAQNSPTPATIFSLYIDGKFITTDISVCMDSRFDKIVKIHI